MILTAGAAAVAAAMLASCSGSGASKTGGGDSGGTFVFGSSRLPTVLDGAYVYDNESQRVIYQMFDRLVNVKPGTTELTGELATSWEVSPTGLDYTFHLRDGVKFHDGTSLDAEAVCYNFDRLYNLKGPAQDLAEYWRISFRGFAGDKDSRYKSCEVKDPATPVLHLKERYTPLLASLASIGFGIASPTALKKYGYQVELSGDSMKFVGTFGTEHPVGSGPFQFKSWDPGKKITLERFDGYWGDKAKINTLIYVPIADGQARRQALERGEIDGYDNVAPQDVAALKGAGYEVEERPPSNVGYLAMNQSFEPLGDLRVRQAIAHAVDLDALLKANFLAGAVKPKSFLPPTFMGFNPDVITYDYDPAKAKELLAGVSNKKLDIWFATEVSRPYMPDPKSIAETFKSYLEKVGFDVTLTGRPWSPDFLAGIRNGKAPMYIVGLLPDMADPANFFTLFDNQPKRWGPLPKGLLTHIKQAEEAPEDKREALYKSLNQELMEDLPGIPYVHAPTHLAFKKGVTGFVPSPLFAESMATVSLGG